MLKDMPNDEIPPEIDDDEFFMTSECVESPNSRYMRQSERNPVTDPRILGGSNIKFAMITSRDQ
jgi:hypothetical protein